MVKEISQQEALEVSGGACAKGEVHGGFSFDWDWGPIHIHIGGTGGVRGQSGNC
jgi:hypothetical protein